MRNRKVLKNFYFRQKFRPDKTHLWKSFMPAVKFDFIEKDKWYQANKDKFLTKGPRLWLLKLIHEKGPLRIDAMYEIYRNNPDLVEQEFFEGLLKRSC